MVLKKKYAAPIRTRWSYMSTVLFLSAALFFPAKAFPAATPASAYENALAAYSRGDYVKAARLLKDYVKDHPTAGSYYLLGYVNYKMGRHRAARTYFSEAYLIDPRLDPKTIFPRPRPAGHGRSRR